MLHLVGALGVQRPPAFFCDSEYGYGIKAAQRTFPIKAPERRLDAEKATSLEPRSSQGLVYHAVVFCRCRAWMCRASAPESWLAVGAQMPDGSATAAAMRELISQFGGGHNTCARHCLTEASASWSTTCACPT